MRKFSDYLTEAVEQLDELSKDTLGRYVKKSAHNYRERQTAIDSAYHKGDLKTGKDGDLELYGSKDYARKAFRKQRNRRDYLDKAVDKLTKK